MKKKILPVILVIAMCTGGCAKEEIEESPQEETFQQVAESSAKIKEPPKGVEIISDTGKFVTVTANQKYQFKTDYQMAGNYQTWVAESENAYYYLDYSSMLHCFDKITKEYRPLCGKPECKHRITDTDCDAVVYNGQLLQYYDGYLYTVSTEVVSDDNEQSGETIWLQKISLDGSVKDNICKIATCYEGGETDADESSDNTFSIQGIIHRGYFYYAYNYGTGGGAVKSTFYNNDSNVLFRLKLDGTEEPQKLMAVQACGDVGGMHLNAQGSYVYFIDPDEISIGELYRFNTESQVIEKLGTGEIAGETFAVIDGFVYYKKEPFDQQIYKRNPNTGEETVFAEMPVRDGFWCGTLISDGTYLYVWYVEAEVYDKRFAVVLDKEGTIVNEFTMNTPKGDVRLEWYGGMNELLLMGTNTGASSNKLYYVEKKSFTEESVEVLKVED